MMAALQSPGSSRAHRSVRRCEALPSGDRSRPSRCWRFWSVIGVWRRIGQRHDQENFAQRTTQLEVNVATAQRDEKPKELILPGTFQAFNQTTIFRRSNGYVESWKVDIGDYVQAGQLLAEIATPEVDQQLAQARAQEEIAKVTADRWRDLLDKKVVSKQEYRSKRKGL